MDAEQMKAELPKWPNYVQPLVNICMNVEAEQGINPATFALAMINAGMMVSTEICGAELAATALIAALDELREKYPDRVELAEAVSRRRRN